MKRLSLFCVAPVLLFASLPLLALSFAQQTNSTISTNAPAAVEPPAPAPLSADAGVDRVVMLSGKTYLNGWAGYGSRPQPSRRPRQAAPPPAVPSGPPPTVIWGRESGPGTVEFADAKSPVTTATFSAPGLYVLKLIATNGQAGATSALRVKVEQPPPADRLDVVYTKKYEIDSPLWNSRVKALIVNWIPHCIDQINRTDLTQGQGGYR